MSLSTPHDANTSTHGAATRAGSRGTITVYREESCPPDEIYYQGSEDEDYDHPDTRLRNCEEAAQRYLSGHAPLLISAALRAQVFADGRVHGHSRQSQLSSAQPGEP
ncbi:hypothetical protein ESCO_003306 [Escovopsis weberi]|uniref:Uncharacterized protein n=1 Tax=Escovopsis weberi TaxID=150374 RepID=A0A0M9VSG2_ESCWE|nr:hypothetical protein ESCO_003306 [Escovopsis weberi]